MNNITDTVKHLIIINVVMFVGTLTVGGNPIGENVSFYNWFALHFPQNATFQPWQIITHMFMHGGFMHIFFNMFALWMFGTAVEQRFGDKKFLFFYISSGLGAALSMIGYYYFSFYSGLNVLTEAGIDKAKIIETLNSGMYNTAWQQIMGATDMQQFITVFNSTMVGASGAIMGVLVAFGMLYPESKLMLIFLPVPIKAKYFIPGIIALDLISAITGQSFFSPSNTAYVAHLGGALSGFLIMWYWKKTQFNKNRWD
ncbi:Membrane associated serine protease, rhomboid family [Bizionia echini]|uniref:Membrane associated serine protease, rhomboid family n=1 Tax=Bizionia echini TaxID=649333 RepID=A0A1I5BF57_9FLAO|nr:rhomboid family intramembrane serine protease [Bizionia echini]SFN73306.1 Membrane associated serine protease, rhomboid family [Bizionia echini]